MGGYKEMGCMYLLRHPSILKNNDGENKTMEGWSFPRKTVL